MIRLTQCADAAPAPQLSSCRGDTQVPADDDAPVGIATHEDEASAIAIPDGRDPGTLLLDPVT